jgi:hypothetical protein
MMNLRKLLEFAATLAEEGDAARDEIIARCRWRDEHGGVVQQRDAVMGYCSGLEPVLTIEMGSIYEDPQAKQITCLKAALQSYAAKDKSNFNLAQNSLDECEKIAKG